jgi:hypothetical protein
MLLVVLFLSSLTEYGSSFNPGGILHSYRLKGIRECHTRSMTLVRMFVNDSNTVITTAGAAENKEKETLQTSTTTYSDPNGNVFLLHSTVKIITPNIKAHHVASKGFGTFSEDSKTFTPASENAERKDKCLVLPLGLMGKVTQIYDSGDSDSSLPLQVKFTPGQSGAYDVPVAFTMHLDTTEVEVIS